MSQNSSASYLPECWSDDERMSSLMSMFKKREINPDGYDSKLKFWSETIVSSARNLKRPYFTHKDLTSRFRRKDRIPACFDVVLRHLLEKGEIVSRQSFSDEKGWLSWGVDTFVKRPLYWVFGYKEHSSDDVLQTEFVLPNVVKEIAQHVFEIRRESNEISGDFNQNVIEWKKFLKEMSPHGYDEKTLILAIAHLQRSNLVSVSQTSNGDKLLKFEINSPSGRVQITEAEKNFYKVKETASALEQEMTRLEEDIDKCDRAAREELRLKNRSKAKSHLRLKLQLVKRVQQKEIAYNNLINIMNQLAQTKEQKHVLDAYKAAAGAFKADLARHGLTVDKVDETMDDIEEALSDHRDINDALARGTTSPTSFGSMDAELEDELADLLKQAEPSPIETFDLPEVPTSTPIEKRKSADRLRQLRRELEDSRS